MNKDSKNENKKRRLYTKPRLEKVQLVLEEAVLTTCKTVTAGPQGACQLKYCAKTPQAS